MTGTRLIAPRVSFVSTEYNGKYKDFVSNLGIQTAIGLDVIEEDKMKFIQKIVNIEQAYKQVTYPTEESSLEKNKDFWQRKEKRSSISINIMKREENQTHAINKAILSEITQSRVRQAGRIPNVKQRGRNERASDNISNEVDDVLRTFTTNFKCLKTMDPPLRFSAKEKKQMASKEYTSSQLSKHKDGSQFTSKMLSNLKKGNLQSQRYAETQGR